MTVYVSDPDFTLHVGDALEVLRSLPDESVNCCVTSPPYWGLRDYQTGTWEGGDADCDHIAGRGGHLKDWEGNTRGGANKVADAQTVPMRQTCGKCGARRVDRQLGLESTPDEYVAAMVAVFREVRQVLRADGTLWLNLGDSYNAIRPDHQSFGAETNRYRTYRKGEGRGLVAGLKQKDLVGIPWRTAFALQQDGWYLRSDIIWSKPNPMPESVTDRPTKAHEYVFLLSKGPRYWYDAAAISEPYTQSTIARDGYGYNHAFANQFKGSLTDDRHPDGKQLPPGSFAKGPDGRRVTTVVGKDGSAQHRNGERWPNPEGRNARSVWQIATQPYPDAHFAVFPEELPRRCILAGCQEGGTVLDPFLGSGTTALVARRHGRRSIGIELSPIYAELAARRLQQLSLLAEATP